jgi:hypothetical protein
MVAFARARPAAYAAALIVRWLRPTAFVDRASAAFLRAVRLMQLAIISMLQISSANRAFLLPMCSIRMF